MCRTSTQGTLGPGAGAEAVPCRHGDAEARPAAAGRPAPRRAPAPHQPADDRRGRPRAGPRRAHAAGRRRPPRRVDRRAVPPRLEQGRPDAAGGRVLGGQGAAAPRTGASTGPCGSYEWAAYNRDAFLAQPGLLAQYLEGAISAEAIAGNVDTILGVLGAPGLHRSSRPTRPTSWSASCALGTAVSRLREREAAAPGARSSPASGRSSRHVGPDDLPYLRAAAGRGRPTGATPRSRRSIATVLCGIAVRRGEDWPPIERLIDGAAHRDAATGAGSGTLVAGTQPG